MINWNDLNNELSPIPSYEDLSKRLREAFFYPFVQKRFNFSMIEMADYTSQLLGGDTKNRYKGWMEALIQTFRRLAGAEVRDVLDLVKQVENREMFEGFAAKTGIEPKEVISVLKYLVYWFIPGKKYLGELVENDPLITEDLARLRSCGIRSNLDILDKGGTAKGRRELVERSGVMEAAIIDLVNRADFSRLPWTRKATISNFIGSGYGSLARLANADMEQVSADFYRYGASIQKNLKFGNEIDNAHRIAKIAPKIVEE